MRHFPNPRHATAVVAVLVLLLASLHGAVGQEHPPAPGSVSHSVRVSIASVLRLQLDESGAADRARVDLDIHVRDGLVQVEPSGTRLVVFANQPWQLTASYSADEGRHGDDLTLYARLPGGPRVRLEPFDTPLLRGAATRGWHDIDIDYFVDDAGADGTYRRTITYTLAQP